MSKEVVFTNHIGRSTRSGECYTIGTLADLKAVEKHNNHDYTEEEVKNVDSNIDLNKRYLNRQYTVKDGKLVEVRGHLPITENVLKVYEEIERLNQQAGKLPPDAKNYFKKLAKHKKRQIAVQGILQVGNYHDWKELPIEARIRMSKILLSTILEMVHMLDRPNARFIIVGISLHLNEGTPHLHYVGVPVEYDPSAKDGYVYRVKKSALFNEITLGPILQDSIREFAQNLVYADFGWIFQPKEEGRNKDFKKYEYLCNLLQKQLQQNADSLNALKECGDKKKEYTRCYENLDARIHRCRAFALQRDEMLQRIPRIYRKQVAALLDEVLNEREEDATYFEQAKGVISDLLSLLKHNPVRDLDEKIQKAEEIKNSRLSLDEIVRNAEARSGYRNQRTK